ncbi:MAG: sugar phosphate isomerase/epimerase [Planctomycetota bacterium]|jgi:hypothetical protein|nr:sugar phosphate isomerase/epimerase [Planctomycetota bacterium]
MRIGIGTYTFPWAIGGRKYAQAENLLPTPLLVETAGKLPGIQVVQVCDRSAAEELSVEDEKCVKARASDLGVMLQVGTRGIEPGHLSMFLSLAARLGCDLVRTMLPISGPGSDYPGAASILREVLPEFENAGIKLSLENHDRNPATDLRRLVERVANPMFGICLDTVNSYGIGEDSERVLDILAPVANCFHAKDYRIIRADYGLGFHIIGAPVGEGLLNIPGVLDRFAKAGIDPDIIIEHWTPPQTDIGATLAMEAEWARRSAYYLYNLLRQRTPAPAARPAPSARPRPVPQQQP